jgi:hypothetical protein
MNFNHKLDNLEIRSCTSQLLLDGEHITAELIEWMDEKSCYVIAYWKKGKEGYDLIFVGDRPFDNSVNARTFMKIAEIGQTVLDIGFINE